MLYDILADNNGTGNVSVGAKSFNVTCGSIPNTTVTGTPSNQPIQWQVATNYAENISLDMMGKKVLLWNTTQFIFLAAPYVTGNAGNQMIFKAPYPGLVSGQEFNVDLIIC